MHKNLLRFLVAFLFSLSFICGANAQTDSYAITNVKIVTVSGATIEKGTIIIRDGLIEEVGANVKIPADVKSLDATGLTAYPGFFDANSNLGIPAAARPQGGGAPAFGQPQTPTASTSNSNFPSGLQPETSASELIRTTDSAFENARNNGITTALSVPRDGIFLGTSSLILTAGDSASTMILRENFGQHITYRTLQGGGFPTALMGTFAAIRQMLMDAKRLQDWQKMYATNPRGVKRPDADKSLAALFPVLNREIPLVINANTEREIIRSIDLAKEFNVRLVIAGGLESAKVVDRLKSNEVTVLLSLNLPKRTTASSPEADREDSDVMRFRIEAPKTASVLQKNGVKFAFQSGGLPNWNDYLGNAAKTVENGLAKDDAIKAMTINAAEIFGVANRLGSIETGKIANLVVIKGDIFAKDKAVTHVFVDGKLFEQKPPPKPDEKKPTAGGAATPTATFANVNGVWTGTIEIPGQPLAVTFNFSQQAEKLTGTMVTQLGTSEVKDGKVTPDGFSFTSSVVFGGATFDISVSGKVTGNQISGTVNSPQGAIPFTGSKNP